MGARDGWSQNLILNGGFEGGLASWTNNVWEGNASFTVNGVNPRSGDKSLLVQVSDPGSQIFTVNSYSNGFELQPNTIYFFSFWARANVGGARLDFLISNNVEIVNYETYELTGDYVKYEGTFTTPDEVEGDYQAIVYYGDGANYRLDDFELYRQGSIQDLVAVPGDRSVSLKWPFPIGATKVELYGRQGNDPFEELLNGQLDGNSTKATITNLVNDIPYQFRLEIQGGPFDGQSNTVTVFPSASWSVSMIENGGFENEFEAWDPNVFDGAASFSLETDDVCQGDRSLRVDVTTPSPLGAWPINAYSSSFVLAPSLTYTFTFWAKAGFSGALTEVFMKSTTSDEFIFYERYNLTDGWKQYTITFTTSDSTEGDHFVGFQFGDATTYLLDNVTLRGPLSDLAGIPGNNSALLKWTPAAGATNIRLLQRKGNGVFQEVLPGQLGPSSSRAIVNGLENGAAYTFFLEITGGPFAGESNRVTLVPTAAAGESLITNGGFEEGLDVGWTHNIWEGSGEHIITTFEPNVCEGNNALRVEVTAVPPSGAFAINTYSNEFTLVPSTDYIFSFWAKAGNPFAELSAVVGREGDIITQEKFFVTTQWKRYEARFSTGPDITGNYQAIFYFGAEAQVYFIDYVSLTGPVSTLQAIPGDGKVTLRWRPASGASSVKLFQRKGGSTFDEILPGTIQGDTRFVEIPGLENAVPYTYKFNVVGGPYNGESNESKAIPGPDLLINPGFEFSFLNWENSVQDNANAIFSLSTNDTRSGSRAMRVDVTDVDGQIFNVSSSSNFFPVKDNSKYTYSFWGKATEAGKTVAAFIQNGDFSQSYGFQQFDMSEDWDIYHFTFDTEVLPADTSFRLIFYFTEPGSFFIDDGYVGTPDIDAFCAGGRIRTSTGDSLLYACPGDGIPDLVKLDSVDTDGRNYLYVVTNENNVIQQIIEGDMVDFDTAGVGVSRLWGLSFSGSLSAPVGQPADSIRSSGCFALSQNFISVIRDNPNGGVLSFADTAYAGDSVITFCLNDSVSSLIPVSSVTPSVLNYVYVVTDPNNVIQSVSESNVVDFDTTELGTHRIWGLSYSGILGEVIGQRADTAKIATGCWDLSDNFLTVTRDSVDGGRIASAQSLATVFLCLNDTLSDVVFLTNNSSSEANYAYVVTDVRNNILALSDTNRIDFSGQPGIRRIWGVSYSGNILAKAGDRADSTLITDACFDISSNFITVIADSIDAGRISAATGDSVVNICQGDDTPDFVSFSTTSTSQSGYAYLVTTASNVILSISDTSAINFNNAQVGLCRVWGLSFSGAVTAKVGQRADSVELSNGCYELTPNYVTVIKDTLDGGRVATATGGAEINLCLTDTVSNVLDIVNTGSAAAGYAYLITDSSNVILTLVETQTQTDTVKVNRTILQVDSNSIRIDTLRTIVDSIVSMMDTFKVSKTEIQIDSASLKYDTLAVQVDSIITQLDTIQVDSVVITKDTLDSAIDTAIVKVDSIVTTIDTIQVDSTVINTDTLGNPIDTVTVKVDSIITTVDTIQVDSLVITVDSAGITMDTTTFKVDSVFSVPVDTIQVNKTVIQLDSTSIVLDTVTVLVDSIVTTLDTIPVNKITIEVDSSSISIDTVIVQVDSIFTISGDTTQVDFTTGGCKNCRIWGISYLGNLTVAIGQRADTAKLSDGCFELSANFISVKRDDAAGCVTDRWDDLVFSELRVYPVPTQNQLFVSFRPQVNVSSQTRLQVFDLAGKRVYEEVYATTPSGLNEFEINATPFEKGLYILRLINGEHVMTSKFIKQ